MNFYKHHLGDYDGATLHLNWEEDMAFTRMIRVYYRTEKPLPLELRAVWRLVRAVTKEQRQAVEDVLTEFFEKRTDGWHNKRCDEEIAAAHAQAEINKRIAHERETKRLAKGNGSSNGALRDPHEALHGSSDVRSPIQTPDSTSQYPDTHTPNQPLQSRARLNGSGADPGLGSVCVEKDSIGRKIHASR